MEQNYAEYLDQKYNKEELSYHEIGRLLNKHPTQIMRDCKKLGFKTRNKSDAVKVRQKKGIYKTPTEGKHLSEKTKAKISESINEHYKNISDEERDILSKTGKASWAKRDKENQQQFRQKAVEGRLKAAKEGSKQELFVIETLKDAGYRPIHQKVLIFGAYKYKIDIMLVDVNVCIEVDGPSHFQPIWGQEKLEKTIASDNIKNGNLISQKFHVIRLRYKSSRFSHEVKENIKKELLESIEKIKKSKTPQLLYIGAKNG